MTEQYSAAIVGMGTQIYSRRGDPAVVEEILGHEDIDFPDLTPPRLNATHMRSPGGVGEEINGPRAAAAWEVPLQYWPGSDTDVELKALAADQQVFELLIVIDGNLRAFAAKVMHYQPTNIPMGEKVMAVAKMSVMAEVSNPDALPA
jgi:hypothetical protein